MPWPGRSTPSHPPSQTARGSLQRPFQLTWLSKFPRGHKDVGDCTCNRRMGAVVYSSASGPSPRLTAVYKLPLKAKASSFLWTIAGHNRPFRQQAASNQQVLSRLEAWVHPTQVLGQSSGSDGWTSQATMLTHAKYGWALAIYHWG